MTKVAAVPKADQVSGNGGWSHHGASFTSIDATHLTHQNPRQPGATTRAGYPWPDDSSPDPTRVATHRFGASLMGKRRA
jgi:hypothetical protein